MPTTESQNRALETPKMRVEIASFRASDRRLLQNRYLREAEVRPSLKRLGISNRQILRVFVFACSASDDVTWCANALSRRMTGYDEADANHDLGSVSSVCHV